MTAPLRAAALALTLASSFTSLGAASAQDYPVRPVKIVVPFGAGGPADVYSRVLAQHLSEALKQPFVVEDRPGAGSIIGTDAVAKSPPDGYTLLAMSNTHTTNESLVPNKPFQLMRDFVPVAGDQLFRPGDGGSSVGAGEGPQGVHRLCEIEAGRAQLCLVRHRHALSHGGRAVQSDERHQHRPCPAQGFGRNAQQRHRRPRADDVRRHHHHGAEREGRPGARARHLGRQALDASCRTFLPSRRRACPATTPPSGSASWRRPARPKPIVDKLNAEINKAINRPDVKEAWDKQGAAALSDDAGRVRGLPAQGHRQMGAGGEGLRRQAQ